MPLNPVDDVLLREFYVDLGPRPRATLNGRNDIGKELTSSQSIKPHMGAARKSIGILCSVGQEHHKYPTYNYKYPTPCGDGINTFSKLI